MDTTADTRELPQDFKWMSDPLIGAVIVAIGKDGSLLVDTKTGGRMRIFTCQKCIREERERDESTASLVKSIEESGWKFVTREELLEGK